MKKKKYKKVCYITYLVIAFCSSFCIKDTFEREVFSNPVNIWPQVLAVLILIATSISIGAVSVFNMDKDIIHKEALKVGIEQKYLKKIEKKFKFVECLATRFVIMLFGVFAKVVVKFADNGHWQKYTSFYASVLVAVLIAITLYGYVYFLIIIWCIKDVYDSDFKNYSYIYPLATDIFEKFNQICTFGLVCFWVIGFILIGLSFIVFDVTALAVLLIIGGLIGIGYIVFTFYPYYKTRRKVSLLKMQTIRDLCQKHNLLYKNDYDKFHEIIKFIWDSPTVLTTNFNLVLTSTVAAIASLLTPLISIL